MRIECPDEPRTAHNAPSTQLPRHDPVCYSVSFEVAWWPHAMETTEVRIDLTIRVCPAIARPRYPSYGSGASPSGARMTRRRPPRASPSTGPRLCLPWRRRLRCLPSVDPADRAPAITSLRRSTALRREPRTSPFARWTPLVLRRCRRCMPRAAMLVGSVPIPDPTRCAETRAQRSLPSIRRLGAEVIRRAEARIGRVVPRRSARPGAIRPCAAKTKPIVRMGRRHGWQQDLRGASPPARLRAERRHGVWRW